MFNENWLQLISYCVFAILLSLKIINFKQSNSNQFCWIIESWYCCIWLYICLSSLHQRQINYILHNNKNITHSLFSNLVVLRILKSIISFKINQRKLQLINNLVLVVLFLREHLNKAKLQVYTFSSWIKMNFRTVALL